MTLPIGRVCAPAPRESSLQTAAPSADAKGFSFGTFVPGLNVLKNWDGSEDLVRELIATILAVQTYRLEPTDDTVITLEERRVSSPEAIGKWFYPGELEGCQP